MSSMNPEHDYSNLAESIRFAIRQSLKDIYTCAPGIVESYDPATRRAEVRGALKMVTTDGDEVTRAPVRNVPVVFPSGGGFALTFPLRKGDPVLLVYSQRGLARWKKAPGVSTPDVDGFFSEKDAIAIPGFGDSSQEPGHLIEVGPEGVRIMTSGTVAIEAQDVTFKTVGTDEAPESIT